MQILHKFYGYTQPIHVHCFMGDAEFVKEWMTNYSNDYFGFTGALENFGTDQIAGLQSVRIRNRLPIHVPKRRWYQHSSFHL